MPPPKKAAKKAAKKAVNPQEEAGKDTRRAYEHLGRVEVLHASLSRKASLDIATLTRLAQRELTEGHAKEAADLLRSAEHLSFGHLSPGENDGKVDQSLLAAISKEFTHKLTKAAEHWADEDDHHEALEEIYSAAASSARSAFEQGAYRKALEFARSAEALAHVALGGISALPAGSDHRKLGR